MPKAKSTLPVEAQIKKAVLTWDKPVSTEAIAEHLESLIRGYRRDIVKVVDPAVVESEREYLATRIQCTRWMLTDTLNILWKTGIIDYADRTDMLDQLYEERKAKEEEANAKDT